MKLKQSWDEVTIAEYQRINKITEAFNSQVNLASDDMEFMLQIISILSGEEIEDLPVSEYNEACRQIMQFISNPPKVEPPKTKYILGGETFIFSGIKRIVKDATVRELKAIQYIDALRIAEDQSGLLDNLHKLLAVILDRKGGKKYNEKGFSVSENADIIRNNMTITDAISIQAFFLQLSEVLTGIIKNSSGYKTKKKCGTKNVFRWMINLLKRGDGTKMPGELQR